MGHSATVWDQRSEFEVSEDWNDIDQVVVRVSQGAFARAIFKPPKAMRGGIQICFPQHGFARNRMWSIDNDPPPLYQHNDNDKVSVDLLLKPSEDDMKCWPPYFEIRLRGVSFHVRRSHADITY